MTSSTPQSARTSQTVLDLDDFIAEHHQRLVGLLTLRTGSRVDAEDLAQEALLKLVQRWDQVGMMDHPWAWLATVGVNLSTARWRRLGSAKRALGLLSAGRVEEVASEEGLVDVLDAVARLPERQRKALLLRHYARLSVNEASEAMNCAPGTVKALTHQAITSMRGQLVEEITEPDDVEGVPGTSSIEPVSTNPTETVASSEEAFHAND